MGKNDKKVKSESKTNANEKPKEKIETVQKVEKTPEKDVKPVESTEKKEIKKNKNEAPKIPQIIIDQPEFEGIKIPPKTIYLSNEAVVNIKICFENDEDEATNGAWIGLYHLGASDESYISQGPVKAKGKKYYKFYFQKGKETIVPFKLPRTPVGPYVEIATKFLEDGKSIEVSYDQKMGLVHINSGWIGLISKDGKTLEYHYIKKATGTVTFKKPLRPDEYRVKLFWEDSVVAESEPIKIEGKDSISVKVEKSIIIVQPSVLTFDAGWSLAWIGLYKADEKDMKNYIDTRYVGSRHNITFSAVEKGDYVVRVFPKYSSFNAILEEKVKVE